MVAQFALKSQPAFFADPRRGCANRSDIAWFAPDLEARSEFNPKPAKQVCKQCPFITECLTYALKEGIEHGVWGGQDERTRRAIMRCLRKECSSRCSHEWRRKVK